MDQATIAALGREIYQAERAASAREPLTKRYADLTPASAYAVQESYAGLRVGAGARVIGRKIGCTSRAIQEFFGIDTPDYGHLFDDMLVSDGGSVDAASLIAPMVEPELAFVLGADLRGPGVTVSDVLAVTTAVAPALEIIDSRIRDWDIAFADTVADNGSSARCVFGHPVDYSRVVAERRDLTAERVRLCAGGTTFDEGTGAAVLGHPAAAVAWLANALADYGHGLRADDFVLSGSITRAVPARAGETYEAVFSTFGTVSCRFT